MAVIVPGVRVYSMPCSRSLHNFLETRMAKFEEQLRRDSPELLAAAAGEGRLVRRRIRENRRNWGLVQTKVTPQIVAEVCDLGVEDCRPQRGQLQIKTDHVLIPSVTQKRAFLNHVEIGRTLAHRGPTAEGAIEHRQSYGALAFMATENGPGSSAGRFLVRDPVAHRCGGGISMRSLRIAISVLR